MTFHCSVAIEWFLIMNLLSVQLWSPQSIMLFDHALYMATYSSQNMVPLRSGCTCQHPCLSRWPEAWIQWVYKGRPVCGIIKTMGHKTTRTVISIRPKSWWKFEQLVCWNFNQPMTADGWKCASLQFYLFMLLSLILTLIQGHSNSKWFKMKVALSLLPWAGLDPVL